MHFTKPFTILVLLCTSASGAKKGFCLNVKPKQCHKDILGVEGPIPPGEAYQARQIGKLMSRFMQERDFAPSMRRPFHPNQHGCPTGYFKLVDDLDSDLVVAPFKRGVKYKVTSSFATSGPFYVPDTQAFEKSLAIKIHGIKGRKLQTGYENSNSMDFLMNGSPTFFTPDVAGFYNLLNYLIQHGDSTLSQYVGTFEENGKRIQELGADKHAFGSVFDATYFSQTPYLWGKHKVIKFRMKPQDPPSGKPIPNTPEGYLDEASERLSSGPVCFDFEIQEQEDGCAQPIEDATVEWETEFKTVAEVCFDQQTLATDMDGSPEDVKCRNSFFQPWLVTKNFRPLGGINRARLHPYREVGEDRGAYNGYSDANLNAAEQDNQEDDFDVPYPKQCNSKWNN